MKGVLLCAVAATLLAACASTETTTAGKDKEGWVDRHYRTGSNLPVKGGRTPEGDGVTAVSGDDYENASRTSSAAAPPSMPMPRPGGGS